jgi:hypothetical protein
MNRDELAALPNAIDMVLTLPDAVRDQVDRWFTPQAAKPGNGHDPHRRRSRRWKRLQKRRVSAAAGPSAVTSLCKIPRPKPMW